MDDLERRARAALNVPGYDDRSMWPPPGQVLFETITGMDESEIDRRLRLHLKGEMPFHGQPYRKPRDPLVAARALELKRIVLAALEGYPLNGESIDDWYDPFRKWAIDKDKDSLRNVLDAHLTRECKQRIRDVRANIAREAAVFAPDERNREILAKINNELSRLGFDKCSMTDILNLGNLPKHHGESLKEKSWDIRVVLQIFLLSLTGVSRSSIAERVKTDVNTLSVIKSRHLSAKAKDILKSLRRVKKRQAASSPGSSITS